MVPMPLGVMGAMPEEIDALLPQIREQRAFDRAGRRFIHGSVHGVAIVVVFSRWGKVAAASTATELIVAHGVDRLVFSGVAGSLREDVMVGDVVVATSLSQHDLDASPFFPPRMLPPLLLPFRLRPPPQLPPLPSSPRPSSSKPSAGSSAAVSA